MAPPKLKKDSDDDDNNMKLGLRDLLINRAFNAKIINVFLKQLDDEEKAVEDPAGANANKGPDDLEKTLNLDNRKRKPLK